MSYRRLELDPNNPAAAGWLAAILGPDGCIAALERAIANLRARRNALELHRAQPARGVH